MSAGAFLIVFAAAGGAIAAWVDVRFPHLAPGSLTRTLVHVGIAMGVAQLVVPASMHLLTETGSRSLSLVAVVGIGFPALAYCFLAALWTMKVLKRGLGGVHR